VCKVKLGEFLLQEKVITDEQLVLALTHQKENPQTRIGVALVKLGFVDVKTIVETLAKQKPEIRQDVPALPEQGVRLEQGKVMSKLGEILLMDKSITSEQIQKALDYQQQHPGMMFGQSLINLGFVTRKTISRALLKMRQRAS
jgi:hypothetical protein